MEVVWWQLTYLDLDLVPPVPVGTLGSSLIPERTIHCSVFSLFPWDVSSCKKKQKKINSVVTTGAVNICAKLQSHRYHQKTNTQLFTGWVPFLSPDQRCQSTEWCLCCRVTILSLEDLHDARVLGSVDRQRTVGLQFSPNNTYLATWEPLSGVLLHILTILNSPWLRKLTVSVLER